jgi:DNA-binding NarL/FixJ family response regulator
MLKFTTKIMIVDDHPIVRYGVAKLIAQEVDMEVCRECDGTEDLVPLIEEVKPDVLILDISLGEKDGIVLTRQLRNAGHFLPIIMLSMHDNRLYVSRAIRSGANGYIVKGQSHEHLVEAIREVRQGKLFFCGEEAEEMLRSLTVRRPEDGSAPIDELSDRELQIFTLIGRGYSTVEVAQLVGIKPKTVETYRARIKVKLNLDAPHKLSLAAIEWATRQGLTASTVS